MGCHFCGGGDRWIKTCRALDGPRLRVCDPCYASRAPALLIVPGDHVVTARCDRCGVYANPREFAEVRPGGRHDCFSGTCAACVGGAPEGAATHGSRHTRNRGDSEGEESG